MQTSKPIRYELVWFYALDCKLGQKENPARVDIFVLSAVNAVLTARWHTSKYGCYGTNHASCWSYRTWALDQVESQLLSVELDQFWTHLIWLYASEYLALIQLR